MSQRRLFYGWTVLAAAATIVAIGQGALLSFGVFLKPLEESMRWNRSDISMVALLNWLAMGAGSFVWGALSDRLGGRVVAVAGGLLMGLGFVVSSQVTELWQLDVTFGLAVGVVSAGSGLGLLLFSPLARWLTNTWDWRIAMLVLGDLAWLVVIPAALLIRNAPSEMGAVALGGGGAPQREYSTAQVFRTPQFWAIALTHLACCATHAGPIFHMVTHAIDQGVLPMVAATALGVSGLSSIAGRIGCGVLADRFGAKRTLVAGLALQAVMVFSYLFTRHAGDFYAVAIVFGVAYGGVMPLYALVTREYFGEKVMGTAYGAVFFISTLGMGLGSWAGGFIHDHLGTYGWLYGGSAAIGAAATLMAFSFRSPRLMAQGATSS